MDTATRDDLIASLPQYAQDYTPEQRQACVEWLADLPLKDLRQRQSIMGWQITEAVRRNLAEKIIADLQEKNQQLMDAVGLKLDRKDLS